MPQCLMAGDANAADITCMLHRCTIVPMWKYWNGQWSSPSYKDINQEVKMPFDG